MILGIDDPCHVWKISLDFHLLLILWKDSHLQLAVVIKADIDVGVLNSLVHHLENHWSNPMVTTGLIRSEEGLKRKHGWLNGFHAGESYSMGVIFRVRWKCFKLTALTMPPMMLLAGFWFWLFWFRFGLVTWELVGWLVGNLRLLIFSNHSNVFTAAKPFLQKTNLCISQNRFCSTDASLLKGLNSFTAPRSPPRIEPASTLPPLLPSFSFSRFRFGRPRRSPRLKRTEEQDGLVTERWQKKK